MHAYVQLKLDNLMLVTMETFFSALEIGICNLVESVEQFFYSF